MVSLDSVIKYCLLLYYVYHSLSGLMMRRKGKPDIFVLIELIMMFWASTMITPINPLSVLVGIFLVIGCIPLMFALTHKGYRIIIDSVYLLPLLKRFVRKNKRAVLLTWFNSLREELIWRVVLCFILKSLVSEKFIVIVIGTILFSLSHIRIAKPMIISAQFELLLFSLSLYTIYVVTMDVFCVWLMHFTRNISIKACRIGNRYE